MESASRLAQTKAKLKQLAARVYQTQDALSYIDAGFLLRSHLEDYVAGVYFLIDLVDGMSEQQIEELRTATEVASVNADLGPTLRRLCQLSREVSFAANPKRISPELRSAIEQLFRFTVEQVPELCAVEANEFLGNIRERSLQSIAVY